MLGSGFLCRIDAFDRTLYCYGDPIAENHLNALENTKNTHEKHIVSFGDYLPKTAYILDWDGVTFEST